jgi:hypothetical protein
MFPPGSRCAAWRGFQPKSARELYFGFALKLLRVETHAMLNVRVSKREQNERAIAGTSLQGRR